MSAPEMRLPSALPGATDIRNDALDGAEGAPALADFLRDKRRVVVITGAGCSTDSGIPDYRDADGAWKHRRPVLYQDFVKRASMRQRYWARSLVGWRRVADARPNGAHSALAALEASGRLKGLITQNVDGLHQRAGSRRVVDLHGRLDTVVCLSCGTAVSREAVQEALEGANPQWDFQPTDVAPDGDVDLEGVDYGAFAVPECGCCGGVLKPWVVFFGENVPAERVTTCFDWLDAADGVLVVGSSLMVRSGYRFAVGAAERDVPIAAVNLGRTRADALLSLKVDGSCTEVLPRAAALLHERQ